MDRGFVRRRVIVDTVREDTFKVSYISEVPRTAMDCTRRSSHQPSGCVQCA